MGKNYRKIKTFDNYFDEHFVDKIEEKMGVPDGNIESAQTLFKFIIDAVNDKGDKIIQKENLDDSKLSVLGNISLTVGEIEFKNIEVGINLNFNDEDFVLVGMSVSIGHTSQGLTHLEYDKDKKALSGHKLNLNYVIIEDKTTWKDIHDDLLREKSKNIGSLAHELKHLYDKYMFKTNMFSDIVSYNSFSNLRLGIKPIDEFIYFMYLTSKTENLVRSTEIAAEIKELDIKKSEFKDFLKTTRLYSSIKKAKNFSYEKLKKELYKPNNIEIIKKRLEEANIDTPDDNEELVNFILKLTYQNIVGDSVKNLAKILKIHDPLKSILGLIKDEEIKHYNKHIKKTTFKNKDKFFEYWEKMITFEANKVFKKVSKLYDMCKDDENKDNKSNKSIIDPKAHDKHIANKSIRNYESFFNDENKDNSNKKSRIKNFKQAVLSNESTHSEYRELVNETKELIYKHAVPYKGSYRGLNDSKLDRVLPIHQSVSVSTFDLEYTYLEAIYTKENIQEVDEYNNPIDGFYNVEYARIFLDEETYKKYKKGELKSKYVDTSTSTISKVSPIYLKASFTIYEVDVIKSILEAIKKSIK